MLATLVDVLRAGRPGEVVHLLGAPANLLPSGGRPSGQSPERFGRACGIGSSLIPNRLRFFCICASPARIASDGYAGRTDHLVIGELQCDIERTEFAVELALRQ